MDPVAVSPFGFIDINMGTPYPEPMPGYLIIGSSADFDWFWFGLRQNNEAGWYFRSVPEVLPGKKQKIESLVTEGSNPISKDEFSLYQQILLKFIHHHEDDFHEI
mgnify:CR=1 FL=1